MLTYERKIQSHSGDAVVVISEDGSIELRGYDPEQEDMMVFMTGQESQCHGLADLLAGALEKPTKYYALEWVIDDIRGAWSLAADCLEMAFWAYAKSFYEPWRRELEEQSPSFIMQSVQVMRKIVDVRTRFLPSDWPRQQFDAGVPSHDILYQQVGLAEEAAEGLSRALAGTKKGEARVLDSLYMAVARIYRSILHHGGFGTNFSYGQTPRELREEWFEAAVRDATFAVHHACWARAFLLKFPEQLSGYEQCVDEAFGRFVLGMNELDNGNPWPELKNHGG